MRRIAVGVVAVLVAILAVTVLVATGSDDTRDRRASDAPVDPPDDLVYRADDVATAVEGEDYEVLRLIPGHLAHRAELLLPDGSLLLFRSGRYDSEQNRTLPDTIQIWDPETGERESLPLRQVDKYDVPELAVTSTNDVWISWNPRDGAGYLRKTLHYDRRTGQSSVYTAPRVDQARSRHWMGHLRPGGDGRLYFMTGDPPCHDSECPAGERRELWSFDPERPDRVRKEGQGAVEFSVSDDLLAYITYDGNGTVILRIRKLGGTRVHQATLDDCWLSDVWFYSRSSAVLASDDAVLSGCGRVYDERARRLATFKFRDNHDLAGVSTRRWVAYGRTVFDTRSGRLLRLVGDRLWHDRGVVMSGDRILFPTGDEPRNTRNGTWTLARLLP
jgi:hypothetical protein